MHPIKYPLVPGQKLNRLTTLSEEFVPRPQGRFRMIVCQCECGTIIRVAPTALYRNIVKSCGCLNRDLKRERNRTHGQSATRTYRIWQCMRARCRNPNQTAYHHYGGRSITICEHWNSFENFLADMGPPPSPQHSIDRIDVNGNYEPSNCQWATKSEQSANCRPRVKSSHCQRGHEWTPENTLHFLRNGRSERQCKKCNAERYQSRKQAT